MCALPSIAVFASCGILFLPGISRRCFSRLFLVAPRAPITIGKLWYSTFSVFLTSGPGTFLSSPLPYLLCGCRLVLLHLFWVLSSACLQLLSLICELVSVCPFWSQSPTAPWLCCSLLVGWVCGARCYLLFWSRSAGICCGGLLLLRCYVLCKLTAILEHELTMWATVSSSLHILHLGSFVVWSIFALWHLVSSAWCPVILRCCY